MFCAQVPYERALMARKVFNSILKSFLIRMCCTKRISFVRVVLSMKPNWVCVNFSAHSYRIIVYNFQME